MIASRARAMSLLGLAFALGLIVGGASLAMAARSGKASWIWRGRGPGRASIGFGMALERKLHISLTAEQRDSVNAITCRGMAAMDSIRMPLRQPMDSLSKLIRPAIDSLFQTIRPSIETRREQTRTEIRALLAAADRERYDSMNRADDEGRKRMRDQGPSGGGGPCNGSPGGPGPRGGFDRGPR